MPARYMIDKAGIIRAADVKVQLLMKSTGVPFELPSDYDGLRSQCPHLGMDLLKSLQLHVGIRSPVSSKKLTSKSPWRCMSVEDISTWS
jgi:hypothetical protein